MKTITLSIVLVFGFSVALFAQKPTHLTSKSVVAESLAAHKDQNPFHFRAYSVAEDAPSVKAVEKSFYSFDDLIDLGEDFICLPITEVEPATYLAKKDIIQKGNPVFDAPQKNKLSPRVNPSLHKN
jgi:hypothetical protein